MRSAWATIRRTTSHRWPLLTTNPAALPGDYLGKGYRNACFGAIMNDPGTRKSCNRHPPKATQGLREIKALAVP